MGQPREGRSLPGNVPLLLEKLSEARFPFGEGGPGNQTSEPDAIVLGDLIQNPNGSPVTEKNPLGIHCY